MDGICICCKQAFEFGKNVFTKEGIRETAISGMCESCFDAATSEDYDEGEWASEYEET